MLKSHVCFDVVVMFLMVEGVFVFFCCGSFVIFVFTCDKRPKDRRSDGRICGIDRIQLTCGGG